MPSKDDSLEPRKERFAFFQAKGLNVRKAAEKAGISETSGYLYRRDTAVMERIAEFQRAMFAAAVGELAAGNRAAARKLRELVKSGDARTSLGAAKAVLQIGSELRSAEFESRLAAIETYLRANRSKKR